jgi:hypothetical protein
MEETARKGKKAGVGESPWNGMILQDGEGGKEQGESGNAVGGRL